MNPVYLTFIVYFMVLFVIGAWFYKRSGTIEDYLLGGRKMGAWVTALSAQASDMSGWLLMGLPGAVFATGLSQIWIAVGLLIGTVLNWLLVARRLRCQSEVEGAITLPGFLEKRFNDPTGWLRFVSALIILLFFTIYASAGLVAAGKLFDAVFNILYSRAVLIGGGVIVFYTFMGGFLAVCWTDLFQGLLMVLAIIVVPVLAWIDIDGMSGLRPALAARDLSFSIIPSGEYPGLMIVSAMAWGLGYFGQPHILSRFMSVASVKKLHESIVIAIVWVVISLGGAVLAGFIGIAIFEQPPYGDPEKIFIGIIEQLCHPWLAGILLAAILSAIMSTIDSQLLVSSSALTEDFYRRFIKKSASERQIVPISRACVIIISAIAMGLALNPQETILEIVAYAWGGLGAAFGPLVLFALYSKRVAWQAALAGLLTGTVVLVIWKQTGLGDRIIYEIVPGFAANGQVLCKD